jgi:uncharacterized protein (DUF1786 family)
MNRLLGRSFIACVALMAAMGVSMPLSCAVMGGGMACSRHLGEGVQVVQSAAALLTAAISRFGE